MIASLADFPADVPNPVLLSAALEGRSLSRHVSGKNGEVAIRVHDGFAFISDGAIQSFLESAVKDLLGDGHVFLSMTDEQMNSFSWSWVDEHPVRPRYMFSDLDWGVVETWSNAAPAEYRYQRIDRDLFSRCEWHDEMSSMLGSEERFLREALGICLLDGDTIVAESYAIISDVGAEMGAITHPDYRGAKNGAITTAHLMYTYLRDQPYLSWSCNQDNVASWKTAERIGFREKREYQFIIIPATDGK